MYVFKHWWWVCLTKRCDHSQNDVLGKYHWGPYILWWLINIIFCLKCFSNNISYSCWHFPKNNDWDDDYYSTIDSDVCYQYDRNEVPTLLGQSEYRLHWIVLLVKSMLFWKIWENKSFCNWFIEPTICIAQLGGGHFQSWT